MNNTQRFSVMKGSWAVTRLDAHGPVPSWALDTPGFASITRTEEELSIVCAESSVPHGMRSETGWSLIKLHGPLPFTETGVLASLTTPLAAAEISLFAVSTFDTDYILVKNDRLDAACEALRGAGHELVG